LVKTSTTKKLYLSNQTFFHFDILVYKLYDFAIYCVERDELRLVTFLETKTSASASVFLHTDWLIFSFY